MEKELKYPFDYALEIAKDIVEQISPFCDRIEIAGSLRRECEEVGDIEIVAIPRPYETGLFESGLAKVVNQWHKVKGELNYEKCKYTQRILPCGIKLDLFFAEPGNWGLIFAIRTGSAAYSHKVLATGWYKKGYESSGGYLMKKGKSLAVPEEKDLYRIIGIPWVHPRFRNIEQ